MLSAFKRGSEMPDRFTLVLSPALARATREQYGENWKDVVAHELRYLAGGVIISMRVSLHG
jgi:hypothetical protein